MGLGKLKFSMLVTLVLLFGTLAAIFGLLLYFFANDISLSLGLVLVVVFSVVMVFIQWFLGPVLIKAFTNMREITKHDYPELYSTVQELSKKANIPMPKVYLVQDGTPNAFAFARTPADGNIAIHTGLIKTLNKEEITSVLAHEVGHIKHWDSTVMTIASMVPMLIYYTIILFAGRRDDSKSGGSFILVWLGAYLAQFLSSLIVMYLSRTREYYADAFSAVATGKPAVMRTALAKIAYGFSNVNVDKYASKRAFYIADPNTGAQLARELKHNDKDHYELKHDEIDHAVKWEKTNPAAKFTEFFSTHPLTYKRMNALIDVEKEIKSGKVNLSNV